VYIKLASQAIILSKPHLIHYIHPNIPMPQRVKGRYQPLQILGAGKDGIVLLAARIAVAIKVLEGKFVRKNLESCSGKT
jgi:hypothetical protein